MLRPGQYPEAKLCNQNIMPLLSIAEDQESYTSWQLLAPNRGLTMFHRQEISILLLLCAFHQYTLTILGFNVLTLITEVAQKILIILCSFEFTSLQMMSI